MKPTVVLTRGLDDSTRLARRLAAHGFRTHKRPLLEIQPLDPGDLVPLPELDARDVLIFISTNAALHGVSLLPAHVGKPACMAVGRRTAAALESAGLSPAVPPREDSEGLLAMPQLQVMAGRRVILVKGLGGRDLIATTLRERGAEVIEFSCYRRYYRPLTEAEITTEIAPLKPFVWLASSGEMVEHLAGELANSVAPELQAQVLVVPSVRVALQASSCGWAHVLTAADASDTAVVELLDQHY